ncbi:MAG TPA: metallophosphoesterase [Stellaceae bacterium]|jgi:3',5'-cyclic AMP phosphodiesterase CpdA|nr:metallophosphoesterase [Stellaceae bacterium]
MSDFEDEGELSRRGLLKCMAWAGGGALWTVSGGVPRSMLLGSAEAATDQIGNLTFMQVSDSHVGFKAPPNTDAPGTLKQSIDLINQQKGKAHLLIHTGDVSQLSKDAQFDEAQQIISESRLDCHYVPGEHDVLVDDGANFFSRFTPHAPKGYYSFDQQGVHFIALNNVQDLKAGGLGNLGPDQLAWMADDLKGRAHSQPIVVMAHIPLWTVSEQWGWGTQDAGQALSLLRGFGSVTVLNGHIHQIMQKVEGNVAFHTARSTAFPQPAPGTAASPGPIKDLPAGRLQSMLGVTKVSQVRGNSHLAIVDTPLGA